MNAPKLWFDGHEVVIEDARYGLTDAFVRISLADGGKFQSPEGYLLDTYITHADYLRVGYYSPELEK